MELGGQLSQGLGFMSNFPTPASAGLAGAAQILGAFSGPAEQMALNPYATHWTLFEPGGCLWGSPLRESDLSGSTSQSGPIKPNKLAVPRAPSSEGFAVVDQAKARVLDWLMRERGSWALPVDGTRCGYVDEFGKVAVCTIAAGETKPPETKAMYRISVLNALLETYRARQVEMLNAAEPSFHYIDRRPWAAAEREAWLREAPLLSLPQWKATKKPATPIHTGVHPKIRTYYDDAKAAHLAWLDQAELWHAQEKASWLEWKKSLRQQYLEQQQAAQLEQAIHTYYQNAEDKDAAAAEIASGNVHFSLGAPIDADDHAPSMWAGGNGAALLGASGIPLMTADEQANDDSGSSLLLLGLVAAGALLLLGGGK